MNAPRISRIALVAGVALGLGTAAPAWADGYHHDHDGFGPAAAIVGLAAAAIAAPYLFGQAQVVTPAPVYAAPPVAYAPPQVVYAPPPPPAYVYAPAPTYVYRPAPAYYGRGEGWHRGWHRDAWHHDDDDR